MMRGMLVNCVAYEDGHKLADIAVEDISDYVSRPGCFVWVALVDPTESELDLMAEEFGLHELAVEDARKGNQAPKIEEYGDTLFCVMRTVEIGLLAGTPGLAALGVTVAALTAGLRGGAALAGLLVIPLAVPLLIFGAGSLATGGTGGLALTGAVSLVLLAMAPFAAGAAIRSARN